ncbi:hypothetical protein [Algicola sagamiensis]|uniref:hypothetical protein n=1 Tax=Algicola sagamiensis TaxID=163869 RepID=UPI000369872C|nr:hypothetical protein [Algicola sagamiensis]
MSNNQIHYNDAPIEQREVKAWFHGERFLGFDEHGARMITSNIRPCKIDECSNDVSDWIYCDQCEEQKAIQKYLNAEKRDVYPNDVIYSEKTDHFFYPEQFSELTSENRETLESLRLYICKPCFPGEIDIDEHLTDVLAEDSYADEVLSNECMDLVEKLNAALRKNKPISYFPSNIAVNLDPLLIGEIPCDK